MSYSPENIAAQYQACDKKVSVKGMVYKLVKAPYGMRAGVIPFYLAYVLANRREDIIVYFSNKEVQITSDIVVNMCEQPEDYAVYVSKEDLQKEKYISELNMLFEVDDNWNLSSNRIKDIIICMQRWFRSLQQATRNVIYCKINTTFPALFNTKTSPSLLFPKSLLI